MNKHVSLISTPIPRQDARAKVTGQAMFADDYNLPQQLYGVMVRLPIAHAKIHRIDYSAIRSEPALAAICDSNDIPGAKKVGVVKADQPIFAFEKIVTPGDVVAMLLGESEAELFPLRDKVQVDVEPLPVLSDPKLALAPDAPLIHPETGTNLIVHHPLRKGDVERGFAESDFIIEQTYKTPLIEHAYIEPECVIAYLVPGRHEIKIIGSIQNPFTARRIVAAALGWPLARVRVAQAELGGSFGGKDDIMDILAARAAIGALKTGRPVKIRYRREESILESYKRHPYIMHYKVGCNRDGKIKAMKIDILADGGAYASMSPFVTWRTVVQATGPYEIEHVWTDVRAVYTNNPYTGAMRGFGSPQPIFAQESLMDEIAIQVGKTPDEIRRLNGLRLGSITATGQRLEHHDVNLLDILDRAVATTDFRAQWQRNQQANHGEQTGHWLGQRTAGAETRLILQPNHFLSCHETIKRGVGLAMSYRGCSLGAEGIDAAAAYLSVQLDGSVYLISGLAENGQGLRTTFSIIAAEVLGLEVEDIFYLEQDTGLVPDSGPTVASRSTLLGGGAVKAAAELVRERLEQLLRAKWQLDPSQQLIFRQREVWLENDPQRRMSFANLCQLAYQQGICLAAIGWYPGPKVDWHEATGQGQAYFTYVYGCQVAEVSVNIATGEVYVERVVAIHNPGTVINRLGALGQIYGGVTQGAGYGLWEEISSQDGSIRELNFDQYLIPTSKDIGEIVPLFMEGRDRYGPWGAKSLGEPAMELTAAAIANAVRNAVGERYFNLPLNLEEILLRRKLHPADLKRGSAR